MSATTSIEWTDRTWNPVRGCSRVSEGCRHCYAEGVAARFSGPGLAYEGLADPKRAGSKWTGRVVLVEDALDEPLRWRKPQRIFVNSMSDLFHEALTFEQIARVFFTMIGEASSRPAPEHTYQVLTKRAERMREFFAWLRALDPAAAEPWLASLHDYLVHRGPFARVWLGVSVENQAAAEERIPELLETPAVVRFLSCEPLLGPVSLLSPPASRGLFFSGDERGIRQLHWVIVGGESGRGARPFDVAWARSLVEQCRRAEIACFVKQLGASPTGAWKPDVVINPGWRARLADRKGGDPAEWPEDLRVREFPEVRP